MTDSDKPEDKFVQFVCFKTEAGELPVDLFQNTWIPVAEKFFSRGIDTVIFSEKLPQSSDLSPYRFVSKNCWASIEAIKGTFPKGLPSPNSRGHIAVSQVIYTFSRFLTPSCLGGKHDKNYSKLNAWEKWRI